MVSTSLLEGWIMGQAGALAILFGLYSIGLVFFVDEVTRPRLMRVLSQGLMVVGGTAFCYVWLLAGGIPSIRWLVYAATVPSTIDLIYCYMTCFDPNQHSTTMRNSVNTSPLFVWTSTMYRTSMTFTMGSFFLCGLLEHLSAGMSGSIRWLLIAVALASLVFALLLYSKVVTPIARPLSTLMRLFLWVVIAAGFSYPILLALSPVVQAVISATNATFGFVLADLVIKVVFIFLVVWFFYKHGQGNLSSPPIYDPQEAYDNVQVPCEDHHQQQQHHHHQHHQQYARAGPGYLASPEQMVHYAAMSPPPDSSSFPPVNVHWTS